MVYTAEPSYDVVIVGAGPAGLSAALILGRCRRKVLLCDRGTSRNWASRAMHGFISRDGIAPTEFAAQARAELERYPSQLGCSFNREGGILRDRHEATAVPGVYAAGNIIRNVQLSIVAAAEGATAAFGINLALTREDYERRAHE